MEKWDKCVHIHACRRLSAIIRRETGKNITRGCGEKCSAYSELYSETLMEELNGIINDAESADDEIRFGAEDNDNTSYARSLLWKIRMRADRLKGLCGHGKDNN